MEIDRSIIADTDSTNKMNKITNIVIAWQINIWDYDGLVLTEVNATELTYMSTLILPYKAWTVYRQSMISTM